MLKRVFLVLFSIFIYSLGTAQNITPKGQFLNDSIQIGEPIPYVLSITYPKSLEIVFPDSLHNFSPFELTSKVYFPTKSDSIFSTDSAIYYLSTFEIDTVQYLQLPVYQINEFDSITLYTSIDSVILKQVVTALPDSVAMIINTDYVEVPMAFNYPYATIGVVIATVIILVLWFIFGKTIKNKIKIYRLTKRNLKFVTSFDQLVKNNFLNCEEVIMLWKSYLEKLKNEPYTKLTTKEIVKISKSGILEKALLAIDKNIYGPKDESLLSDAYQSIKEIAQQEFDNKVNQIQNG